LYIAREMPFSLMEMLQVINVSKNAQITLEDITNTDVPVTENGVPLAFTLSAQDESLVWLGNTRVNILTGIPASAPSLFTFLNQEAAKLFG
jgi:hypothetical protein